jgi:hypothetical protein
MVKYIKHLFLSVALLMVGSIAPAQTCSTTVGVTTCHYNIPDDGHAIVPIPFGFPYYGRIFTHSIFFDNGLVSFYDPVTEGMRLGGQNYFAQPLSDNIGSNFHYSIMPLWSDLRNYTGSYYTQTDGQGFLRYNWENISQFGYPDRLNTFSLEIQPSGFIGINYQQINISGYPVTAGLVGNASLGEWQQHFYASSSQPVSTGSISNWSVTETIPTDCSDPLVNVNCPGYQQAFFNQQCSINALYSPACSGYSEAFFTQQCTISSLYDSSCPGYAVAYYDQQCGLDPLYHTGCPGHDDAYLNQQCGLNTLYDSRCEGYDDAYFDQQCALDALYDSACPLYADAFYVQQCTADPLYDSGCTGYTEAKAVKNILEQNSKTSVVESAVIVEILAVDTTVSAPTANPADTTAAVQLIAEPTAAAPTAAAAETLKIETAAATPAPTTTRQALAERRLAAARSQASQRARDNPDETTSAMDNADSLEQQAEMQNAVVGAMSFVPGFDAYGRVTIPDAVGYKPFEIYVGQRNVDTPAARGLLGRSDRLHQEMVNEQYR